MKITVDEDKPILRLNDCKVSMYRLEWKLFENCFSKAMKVSVEALQRQQSLVETENILVHETNEKQLKMFLRKKCGGK